MALLGLSGIEGIQDVPIPINSIRMEWLKNSKNRNCQSHGWDLSTKQLAAWLPRSGTRTSHPDKLLRRLRIQSHVASQLTSLLGHWINTVSGELHCRTRKRRKHMNKMQHSINKIEKEWKTLKNIKNTKITWITSKHQNPTKPSLDMFLDCLRLRGRGSPITRSQCWWDVSLQILYACYVLPL